MASFRVLFEGRLKEGVRADEVKGRLASLLQVEPSQLEGLFQDPLAQRVLKQGLDRATAEWYVTALETAGAASRLEPDPNAPTEEDWRRFVDAWMRMEARPRSVAKRQARFRFIRSSLAYPLTGLLVAMGGISLLQRSDWLPAGGAPVREAIRSWSVETDKLLGPAPVPSPHPSPGVAGARAEWSETVTLHLHYPGRLSLGPGSRVTVERWAPRPGAGSLEWEVYRVFFAGGPAESVPGKLPTDVRSGRLVGTVRSARQDGTGTRFALEVTRQAYDHALVGAVRPGPGIP